MACNTTCERFEPQLLQAFDINSRPTTRKRSVHRLPLSGIRYVVKGPQWWKNDGGIPAPVMFLMKRAKKCQPIYGIGHMDDIYSGSPKYGTIDHMNYAVSILSGAFIKWYTGCSSITYLTGKELYRNSPNIILQQTGVLRIVETETPNGFTLKYTN